MAEWTDEWSEGDPVELDREPETLEWLEPGLLTFRRDTERDRIDLTLEGDRTVLGVRALAAFPLSDGDRMIQLFESGKGGRGKTVGMLEHMGALNAEDRRILTECLDRERILPEVTAIRSVEDRRHLVHWVVDTDRGPTAFDIHKPFENVRLQPNGAVVVTDALKNRYHVEPSKLDAASRAHLERFI